MVSHRPIFVWVIFAVSIAVACYAAWSLFALLRMGAIAISDYGFTGFVVSMIPALVLLAAGLALFALNAAKNAQDGREPLQGVAKAGEFAH